MRLSAYPLRFSQAGGKESEDALAAGLSCGWTVPDRKAEMYLSEAGTID